MSTTIGKAAPAFSLAATGEKTISLKDFKGQHVVLYFYPRDSTPGCTQQGQQFRDLYQKFAAEDAVILGVSRDSMRSHENFKAREAFPFDLLSDPDEKACQAYDVIKEKNMYGKKVLGVERSTFLIDKKGILRKEWRKVKVPGHVAEVLAELQALNA
ncbi:peroxiredoxin [Permianibacter aggregans]|uniref:thioredoxin-dependent peroxiredoxin n=1 Tax=Permianibacter aggregans TaxID=1510150 RepID=A0A4R6UV71_9GAMM|nr:peroxiredoxin [Permianibacter aggregans]QGX41485.1 peroxiredoxin [Permianibacter aggregans]TDQ51278.1 peroxiredoxin Q/BCP [Permianibacter aggregans]